MVNSLKNVIFLKRVLDFIYKATSILEYLFACFIQACSFLILLEEPILVFSGVLEHGLSSGQLSLNLQFLMLERSLHSTGRWDFSNISVPGQLFFFLHSTLSLTEDLSGPCESQVCAVQFSNSQPELERLSLCSLLSSPLLIYLFFCSRSLFWLFWPLQHHWTQISTSSTQS